MSSLQTLTGVISRSHKQIGKFLNAMRKSKAIDVTEKKGVIHVSKVVAASALRHYAGSLVRPAFPAYEDRKHKVFVALEEKFVRALSLQGCLAFAGC